MDKHSKEPIDWDSYKEHVWVWYMVDNKSLSDILEILKQEDVVATKQQLEFRLKKWRIFKTIKTQEARWMAKQLNISSSAGEPIAFVKSGKILPGTQVAQAVKRHAPPPSFSQKFNTDRDAQLPSSPADLIACSPGPAGLYTREIEPWGLYSTLPWIRFRYALLDGSLQIQIQIRGNAQSSMTPGHHIPMIFASRSARNSRLEVCKFASNLSQIMPEVYTGEHIRRTCAIAQAQSSLTRELLEILIFQLSNNFLQSFWLRSDWYFTSKDIVYLMGAFGLDISTTIRFLFELAADQPTILAVLDKFWIAAYQASTKIASIIFTEYIRRYDDSDEFVLEITEPLEQAIRTENLNLAKVILSGPQSKHVTAALSISGPRLLADCSAARNQGFALAMAALLLERHDQLVEITNGSRPMFSALNSGNIRLARFFLKAGFNLLSNHNNTWEHRDVVYRAIRHGVHVVILIIDKETIFTTAVVPHVLLNDTSQISLNHGRKNRFANRADSEKVVLENYLGLSEMLSAIGKLPKWLEEFPNSTQPPDFDVVVLAALYGYDAFLQTFKHSPSSLNRCNRRGMWPLSAAALGANASTCRLLVRLGADPDYVPPFGNPLGDWPTPLQHAVYHNSAPLVEVLLDLGADINHRSNIHRVDSEYLDEHKGPKSALALAIELRHWETAFLLVHRGAGIDPLAFDLVVQSGNLTLIDLLSNARWPECLLLGCRITEKEDDSARQIVPGNSHTATCDEPSELHAHQITCNLLSKAVSSGSLSLVSRVLEMKRIGSDHYSLQDALTCSLERGFQRISYELIRAGANLSHYDIAISFRSCTLASIREFIATSHDPPLWALERGLQAFTLELAILDNTPDVVQFAFETFPQAYSSGALSSAVLRAAKSDFHEHKPMQELLLRRRNIDLEQLNPILEHTAVAIALLFQAPPEIIESLLQESWPEAPAICCCHRCKTRPADVADFYYKILANIFVSQRNPQSFEDVNEVIYNEPSIYCNEPSHGVMLNLLLTLAVDLGNDQVNAKLMAKGFLADRRTVETAISRHTPLYVLDGVLRSCREGHDIVRLSDHFLHFALDCGNDQVMRHLIHHGASMSAKSDPDSGVRVSRPTVLQRAVSLCGSFHTSVRRCHVQLLLDAGADVNETPAYRGGVTALQAAAQNGQLDLARQLVSLGADINARRAVISGSTCLETAAWGGRLDMTQFLLDAGATTTGEGQLQYIRAVKLAEKTGYAAVAQILRKHRPWDESDESLFQEEGIISECVLHPIEYTTEEIRDLADQIWSISPNEWYRIWPKIDRTERNGTDLANRVSRTRRSEEVSRPAPMHDDLIEASASQLEFDVPDDGSPKSYGIETDLFSSHMVVSNSTSSYSMPLHTSFTQFQADPDFHERIFEVEDD